MAVCNMVYFCIIRPLDSIDPQLTRDKVFIVTCQPSASNIVKCQCLCKPSAGASKNVDIIIDIKYFFDL